MQNNGLARTFGHKPTLAEWKNCSAERPDLTPLPTPRKLRPVTLPRLKRPQAICPGNHQHFDFERSLSKQTVAALSTRQFWVTYQFAFWQGPKDTQPVQ